MKTLFTWMNQDLSLHFCCRSSGTSKLSFRCPTHADIIKLSKLTLQRAIVVLHLSALSYMLSLAQPVNFTSFVARLSVWASYFLANCGLSRHVADMIIENNSRLLNCWTNAAFRMVVDIKSTEIWCWKGLAFRDVRYFLLYVYMWVFTSKLVKGSQCSFIQLGYIYNFDIKRHKAIFNIAIFIRCSSQ